MQIKFLRANHGDSTHIRFKDNMDVFRNILIDGGSGKTYIYRKRNKKLSGELKLLVEQIKEKNESIDLLILTHVDDDHIGGILSWLENDVDARVLIKKVWFNSGRLIQEHFDKEDIPDNDLELSIHESNDTGIAQGMTFEKYIQNCEIWDRQLILSGKEYNVHGVKVQIVSPSEDKLKDLLGKWEQETTIRDTSSRDDYGLALKEIINEEAQPDVAGSYVFEEDHSIHNGSSISFVLSYNGINLLFLGDAHPSVVLQGLESFGYTKANPLKSELVKIAHHGSKNNINYELLEVMDTNKYVICTNGAYFQHPDKRCLARIINYNVAAQIYLNYDERIKRIFSQEDYVDYPDFEISKETEFEL